MIDFNLRRTSRLTFPGACSLEYQSAMQIVLECLFGWIPKKQKGRRGILGVLEAFCRADEEQGRGSLHSHWLIWIKTFGRLRSLLYHCNETIRKKAQQSYISYINGVMSATHGEFEVTLNNQCCSIGKHDLDDTYENCETQKLRDARHKSGCYNVHGNIMQCKQCKKKSNPKEIMSKVLAEMKQTLEPPSTIELPLSSTSEGELNRILDVASYRYVYDMVGTDTALKAADDSYWKDRRVRAILLRQRFDNHHTTHANSCFKKGSECRFFFPFLGWNTGTSLYESVSEGQTLERTTLVGQSNIVPRFLIQLNRPQGCQYMNTHSVPVSDILNCNTNVQAGDSGQTYYQTLYHTKNTQKEDCEPRDLVARQLIRRLLRAQDAARERECVPSTNNTHVDNIDIENKVNDWVEGLSRVLSGINAATSRIAVSAPMAHNLAFNGGSRFSLSHNFAELLVGQLEEILEGNPVNFICRTCFAEDGTMTQWADLSANDYIFRPDILSKVCLYQQFMHYSKCYSKTSKHGSDSEINMFKEGHPGYGFAYIEKQPLCKIPIVSLPEGKLCRLSELDITNSSDNISQDVAEKREHYAKMALLMFCPFSNECGLDGLMHEGSYWKKFNNFRGLYFSHYGPQTFLGVHFEEMPDTEKDDEMDKHYITSDFVGGAFWVKGFEILQNTEDRLSMEKCNGRTNDPVTDDSECMQDKDDSTKMNKSNISELDDESVKDISFFCDSVSEEENTSTGNENDMSSEYTHSYTHANLIRQANATKKRLIAARLSSTNSLLVVVDSTTLQGDGNSGPAGTTPDEAMPTGSSGFRQNNNVLQLISGCLLGGGSYNDVYPTDEKHEEQPLEDSSSTPNYNDSQTDGFYSTSTQLTLHSIARMVAKEENTILDKKQYIMYEVLATTFLLGLLSESLTEESIDFYNAMANALGEETTMDLDSLITKLKQRGAREQLIMFVTGLAGAGKSTAIKVAQRFCFEFCKAASIMWNDNTFLFTAYTGSAAAAFGGLTTSSATFLNKRTITDEDRKMYEGVRILIIDEVSFLKDSELLKLDRNLKKVGDPYKPFGGISIVFGGDFQQIEPVGVKSKEILWSPSSSRHFENNLNCAIVLDGIHRFKDDPKYGNMLKKLCAGNFEQEDIDWINSRVIGKNGLELPKTLDGDACYACPLNMERNSITKAIFGDHAEQTHPNADDHNPPPNHTLIIEADIQSATQPRTKLNVESLRRRIIELGDDDVRCQRKLIDPSLCCYNGAYFMCISNEGLREHGTGNGTQGRLVGVKLKDRASSYRWKVWDNKKIWTVNAVDVEYIILEHHPPTREISSMEKQLHSLESTAHPTSESKTKIGTLKRKLCKAHAKRRFKLKPKKFSCNIKVTPHDYTKEKTQLKSRVTQLPVNASDAITGHKLQGLTKDQVIVYSWNKSTNWIYVVLSRVRSLKGLFLVKSLKLKDIKPPQQDYLSFLERMKNLQQREIDRFDSI